MGKASSAKKVAKVARTSGGPVREQTKLGFPAAVFAIVVLGVLLVVWARDDRNSAVATPPTLADHWHAAYGIFVCDAFLPSLTDVGPDTTGLHTHDDGVAHIHPFSNASTGDRATWAKYGEVVGLQFDGNSFTMPDATTYSDGYDCGGEPATVAMYRWPADDPDAEPVIITDDIGGIRFDEDRLAFTLAVVPEGTEVPRPESIPTLDNLSDVGPNATDPTAAGGIAVEGDGEVTVDGEDITVEGGDVTVEGEPSDGGADAATEPSADAGSSGEGDADGAATDATVAP